MRAWFPRLDVLRRPVRAASRIHFPDELLGVKGDVRKTYRSAVDQSLQPYRLFVPSCYEGQAIPLVVALRGMGDDENSMFDLYAAGRLKTEADQRGMFVVCPKGRGRMSMWRGNAEQDVLEVLAAVKREYVIDASRVYLMGHSMGAFGTWSIAMAHPHLFAALGPISGGGDPAGVRKVQAIPHFIVHGDKDRLVPVSKSRIMVEAARKLEVPHVYLEVPNGNHANVAVPSFGPMLDYFAQMRLTRSA